MDWEWRVVNIRFEGGPTYNAVFPDGPGELGAYFVYNDINPMQIVSLVAEHAPRQIFNQLESIGLGNAHSVTDKRGISYDGRISGLTDNPINGCDRSNIQLTLTIADEV